MDDATPSKELLPPPIPMRKSLSVGNISTQHQTANEVQQFCNTQQTSQMNSDSHKYAVMRDNIMREVLITVPALVSQSLCVQLVPAICQAVMENSMFASVSDTPTDAERSESNIHCKLNAY